MNSVRELMEKARNIRINILNALYSAQSGHPGPSLSPVEILTTLLFKEMKIGNVYVSTKGQVINPVTQLPFNQRYIDDEQNHDILILSKGHAATTLYAALAEAGYIKKEELKTLREVGSRLQGHPVRGTLPFVTASTGSLGQGLSIGVGRALGSKTKNDGRRFYIILGDGECQEGAVWEAAMAASKYCLDNLVAIVDYNKFQNEGPVDKTMPLEPFADKWSAFLWHVQTVNGHDLSQLLKAYSNAKSVREKPSIIIAHTIKGKGISFMEGTMEWHSRVINSKEYQAAMKELKVQGIEVKSLKNND